MKRLEFINVTGSDAAASLSDALGVDDSSRRRIRVQVMKDFWRKEKKQKKLHSPGQGDADGDAGNAPQPDNQPGADTPPPPAAG